MIKIICTFEQSEPQVFIYFDKNKLKRGRLPYISASSLIAHILVNGVVVIDVNVGITLYS